MPDPVRSGRDVKKSHWAVQFQLNGGSDGIYNSVCLVDGRVIVAEVNLGGLGMR